VVAGQTLLPSCTMQGLVALAEALSMSPHVQVLLIWGNVMGPASNKAFVEALSPQTQEVGDKATTLFIGCVLATRYWFT